MSEFESFINGAQETPGLAQFRPCCHGAAQLIRDLTEAMRQRTVDSKSADEKLSVISERLPNTITTEDAAELRQAVEALKVAMAPNSGLSPTFGTVAILESLINLHVETARAGDSPSAALGEAALKFASLMKEQPSGAASNAFLAAAHARAETLIKQAQQANPLFGLTMANPSKAEGNRQPDSPSKEVGRETAKTTAAEEKVATPQSPAKSADSSARAQEPESTKQSAPAEVKPSRAAPLSTDGTLLSAHEPKKSETPQVRQPVPDSGMSVAAEVKPPRAAPLSTDGTLISAHQPQKSETPQVRQPVPDSGTSVANVTKANAPASPLPTGAVLQSYHTTTTAGPSNARQSPASVASPRPPIGGTASFSMRSSNTSSATPARIASERNVSRAYTPVASRHVAQARAASAASRSANTVITNRVNLRTGPINTANRGTRLPQAQTGPTRLRGVGATRLDAVARPRAQRGVSGIAAEGRTAVSVQASRVLTTLAQLRRLSAQELRAIQLNRTDRSKELQQALSIRARAQRIVERIKSLPLKDIQRLRALRSDAKPGKGVRSLANGSEREMLARREVRLLIRDLALRLQAFIDPWSMLYKRLVSELTLADLERLVSMLGGNRAVRGLRKKHLAGEVPVILESDISFSLLNELSAGADGSSAGSDSSGSDDNSTSADEANVETSTEETTEETSLVAEGAVPTATLSTVIVKEESAGHAL